MNRYVLLNPVITEKSLQLASEKNTYAFWVSVRSTKNQVKEAVQELYSVTVTGVRTVLQQKKKTRTGKKRLIAYEPKHKKALVTLKEGDKIDLFEVPVAPTEATEA